VKPSYKAALLSAFVFPGVGQIFLKKFWRGLGIMVLVFSGLGYMIWSATVVALKSLDDAMLKMKAGTANMPEISDIVGSKTLNTDPYYNIVLYLIICFWIFAIIDAYQIGKQKELHEEKMSQL
jgi:TM2 domain-containing membrane protein YozV